MAQKNNKKWVHIMRLFTTLAALGLTIGSHANVTAKPESFGGFLGSTVSHIQTNGIDNTDIAAKIVFGPNITERLALEFGVMDFGRMSYNDPTPVLSDTDASVAPLLNNASQGEIERTNGSANVPGETVYTGPESYQARSVLLNLRYRFSYTDTLDFFFKGGASAWIADVERTRITFFGDGTKFVERQVTSNETSGVELITGAGLLWNPHAGLNVRVEVESTSLDSFYIEPTGFLLYGLGLQYEF